MTNTKVKYIRAFMILLCIFYVLFIFSNSILTASESSKGSSNITDLINNLFEKIGFGFTLDNHIIRKAAHFLEFAILGVLLTSTMYLYMNKLKVNMFIILFIGLVTAVTDEFIQLFIEGRSGQVSDIAIDFIGLVFGFIFIVILNCILKRLLLRKQKSLIS